VKRKEYAKDVVAEFSNLRSIPALSEPTSLIGYFFPAPAG